MEKIMRILCISASNSISGYTNTELIDKISVPTFSFKEDIVQTTSYKICNFIKNKINAKDNYIDFSIIELKNYSMNPCINCIKCFNGKRCVIDNQFNEIYEKIINQDILFIVSAHYAPIPAKLCILLEKMEQISFIHWIQNNSYKSEVYGIPVGLISHGGSGEESALKEYKRVVNDPIYNALQTIQLKLVPFNDEWNTGISISSLDIEQKNTSQKGLKIDEYIERVLSVYNQTQKMKYK
jgi:multimeric flavodoxin WrbA